MCILSSTVLVQYPRFDLPRRRAHVASRTPVWKRLRFCYHRLSLRSVVVYRLDLHRQLCRSRQGRGEGHCRR